MQGKARFATADLKPHHIPMRLKPHEAEAIRQSVAEAFGTAAPAWLFGSRADDSRRGGAKPRCGKLSS
jgi:hypothetical protein